MVFNKKLKLSGDIKFAIWQRFLDRSLKTEIASQASATNSVAFFLELSIPNFETKVALFFSWSLPAFFPNVLDELVTSKMSSVI